VIRGMKRAFPVLDRGLANMSPRMTNHDHGRTGPEGSKQCLAHPV
jgi:hypothetical protein